ncbi:MAG: diguanylate cyclase [Firmicutes bacterium]|nr:diguanylate cyclase [Bacillota bacterium]
MEVTSELLKTWLDGLLCGEFIEDEPLQSDDQELYAIGLRLQQLSKQINVLKDYATNIANGNLNVQFPPRNHYLSGGLKELHTNLLHLIWKVEQITRGNYKQSIDFMGQISEAFNQMAQVLAKRNLQLTQSQYILEIILSFADISLFVLKRENGELLQARENLNNYSRIEDMPTVTAQLTRQLQARIASMQELEEQWQLYSPENDKWYMVNSMPGVWGNNEDAYFHVLNNISETIVLNKRLQHAMYRDTKFPAYNQLYAVEYINGLIQSRSPFVVCYFDLDDFKMINDRKGHDEGDRYILNFINIVDGVIRSHDVFCRVGGDEFLLILSGITSGGAERIIKRMVEKTEHLNRQKNYDIPLSFSYGIETINYNPYSLKPCTTQACEDKQCGTPQCIIRRADYKMYEQKRKKS